MLKFNCDYMEGAHPKIPERLSAINFEKNDGYGMDDYCRRAKLKIQRACGLNATAEVHFLVGGTQTNLVVLDSLLRDNEGVIAPSTGLLPMNK